MSPSPFPRSSTYSKLFNYVAGERIKAQDLDLGLIHNILVVVLATSLMMWSFTILAAMSISSPVPLVVAFVCSVIHLLTPLILKFQASPALVTHIILSTGLILRMTFSFYTGGITPWTMIWLGILPMVGGLLLGLQGIVTWAITSVLTVSGFLYLKFSGFIFPDLITEKGRIMSQVIMMVGWIYISCMVIFVFLRVKKQSEELLAARSKRIDDLIRVLFHDLANPLGRISIGLNITKKNVSPEQSQKGLEIAFQATEAMIEITQNVRKMYAISKGKADMNLIPFSLNEGIDYVKKFCEEDLARKKITIHYDEKAHAQLKLLVDPVSFKNQVLCNIISNAIKFSGERSSIFINAQKAASDMVELKITDQGIGMPPKLLNTLFDLTSKTSRAGTGGETGTGFGMHIMKSFVEMYDGSVRVESQEMAEGQESGTTFIVSLKYTWS